MARAGEPVMLPEQRVAVGEGMVNISVDLPRGGAIDAAVPFRVTYRSGNTEIIRLIPKVSGQTFSRPVFPISIPATFAVGRTTVEIEVSFRWKPGGRRGRSRLVQAVVPVEVAREAAEKDVAALIVLSASDS